MRRKSLSLILFFVYCAATAQFDHALIWEDDRAVAVRFYLVGDESQVLVSLKDSPSAIFGQVSRDEYYVVFRPAVPFSVGETYEVKSGSQVYGEFAVESRFGMKPEIVAVYPTTDTLPANQLKLYVRFNLPMRPDGVYDHIFVANEAGQRVPGVILPLKPALWNHDNTLLTLWFDPGRIKRDLGPNEQQGNPLEPNHTYTIAIDSLLPAASGNTVGSTFTKLFYADDFDRTKPDIGRWALELPRAGSEDPLVVLFDEPLDYRSLDGKFTVLRGKTGIQGEWGVMQDEIGVSLKPAIDWEKGRYTLKIDPTVEDLAGNTLERLFDEDINDKKRNGKKDKWVIDFVIR